MTNDREFIVSHSMSCDSSHQLWLILACHISMFIEHKLYDCFIIIIKYIYFN